MQDAHAFSVMMDDEAMLDCFLNFLKVMPEHPFVLDYSVIVDAQNNDNELLTALQEFPDKYSQKLLAQKQILFVTIQSPMCHSKYVF